jgi:DNA (cytosine-5)-methyltransferase 1
MTFTFASAFTGIGGFDLAFERLGMTCTVQIEKLEERLTTLAKHFPSVRRLDDIATTGASDIGRPKLAVGGFPCQGTSIAAPHRLGLGDDRSGMFWEFRRLLDEYLRLIESNEPRWVVIENPPGLLRSNNGRDMAAVALGLEDLGYGWAYRVVDSRHVGSAQRRQRVLIVGHLGGDPRPAWQVLGDPSTSDQAHPTHPVAQVSRPSPVSSATGDGVDTLFWRKSARPRASLAKGGYETWVDDGVANTLTGFDYGAATRQTHLLRQHGRLRTLTLTEWERLQGFPDGWTEGMTDAERGNALGDAMNVPMADWLGRRLLAVDAALPMVRTP